MLKIRREMTQRAVHPARTVVLVPYAQLMPHARAAWVRALHGDPAHIGSPGASLAHFVPRFETTMNWTRSLGGFAPESDDVRMDAARDVLTAASLLSRAGLAGHRAVLGSRLLEAAWSVARVAAAQEPAARSQWGMRLGTALAADLQAPVFSMEAICTRMALAWAANSNYPTDPVFSAAPDLLIVLEGFQSEPMHQAFQQLWAERVLVLPLESNAAHTGEGQGVVLHQALDAEDEAQRAGACVLAHLAAGRSPVALVAQDRLLTRRVRAMLEQRAVPVRDETGWKLSTTRSAAALMSLLRASVWNASADAVLDWLKNAPAMDSQAVMRAEISWRKLGLRDWRAVPRDTLVAQAQALIATLQSGRTLVRWLADLRAALNAAGQWQGLLLDPAGSAVLDALRLRDGCELEFADVSSPMDLSEFTGWVSQTLEAANFMPEHPSPTLARQVVILPLSQLLGRTVAAVVLPGCDEVRLPVSPEPPGMWTPQQRALLGLPSRAELAEAARAAWRYALKYSHVDVLWRQSEGGEHLMASGFVQELQLLKAVPLAADPSHLRAIVPQPGAQPRPSGAALPLHRLSSTAYEDLRSCPYRFFALRQLRLQTSDELDTELGKRDFGNWLHSVLHHFHEALKMATAHDPSSRVAMINVASEQATEELGLSASEFLPFAAAWPRVREGYLAWLSEHEATGATYVEGEIWKQTPLGRLSLVGKIDRIDRQGDGSALVMDYKTEARSVTTDRIKGGLEDTQLAFYAALLTDDTLSAAYVNVGEKDATRSLAPDNIVGLRDHLLEGIVSDMDRVAAGVPLAALGEGKACEFCAARGLCRKDFWA